jgi:uncharacterized protein YifN (PemK superfamily)
MMPCQLQRISLTRVWKPGYVSPPFRPQEATLAIFPARPDTDLDALCARHGLIKPSRRELRINSAPRVGQYFWVDFPHDAHVPEFVGEHPGIVVRAAHRLKDTCVIVPVTSSPQSENKHIHRLKRNPNPKYRDREVWAICDHLYTIHNARLRPVTDSRRHPVFPRVDKDDMEEIYDCIRHAFPNIFPQDAATVIEHTLTPTAVIAEASE